MGLDLQSAELKKLHAYWAEKAGVRPMPSRRDLDPIIDIPEITPHLWLVDVEDDPPRYRFRLVGTEVVARYGADFTGKRLDEIDLGGDRETILLEYERARHSKAPRCSRHKYQLEQTGRYLIYERLLLPLSDDGETVNMLLCAAYSLEAPEA